MNHFLERRVHFKFHRSTKATTLNARVVHLPPCSTFAYPTCAID
ncbi:MAG: hypothetical protein RM368_21385 [Nostoc sp. DedSLP03]|nr:hypothetical protein [Nostoc sp. DedSLP03]